MSQARRALIFSDLHLGPESRSSFREEEALAALLKRFASDRAAPPTELVLAGDIFDFLTVEGYQGFDVGRAPERLEEILQAPRVCTVIEAISRFASRPGNELTILAGNHDPELLLREVREVFEIAVGRPGSVRHADDKPLRPAAFNWPAVSGRALGPEEAPVWVVHGDRWDPANWIDRAALSEAVHEGLDVKLPPGSHLVFEVLQHLKRNHGWVDELKPELPAVLPLLLYLDPQRTTDYLRRHFGLSARLLRDQIRAYLQAGPLFDAMGRQATADAEIANMSDALAQALAVALQDEPGGQAEVFLAELQRRMEGGAAPVAGTLGALDGLGRWLIRVWLTRVRATDRFQEPGDQDSLSEAATPYLPPRVAALVAGHTHGARMLGKRQPPYFNTGTWLPLMRLPRGDLVQLIAALERGERWPSAAPRTFAKVELPGGLPVVTLMTSDADGRARGVRNA